MAISFMGNNKNKKPLEKCTQGPSFARKIPKSTHVNGRELYYNKTFFCSRLTNIKLQKNDKCLQKPKNSS